MLERRDDVDIFVSLLILKGCFKHFTLKNDVCYNYLVKTLCQVGSFVMNWWSILADAFFLQLFSNHMVFLLYLLMW